MNRGNSNKELIQFLMCPEFWVHIILTISLGKKF